MKKSNWIIVAILVVASAIFLWLWYALGFNFVDDPLDLVVSIVWWVIIIAVCVAIHLAEKKRQRSLRTSFLASGVIYNPEAGIVRLDEGQGFTPALERILDNMQYGFDQKDTSDGKRIKYDYIVRSDKFSDSGDTWEGEVVKVSSRNRTFTFQNREELAHLIDVA